MLVRTLTSNHPQWIEAYYSRGLFVAIRVGIDYLLAWLPVPLIYLFFAGLIYYLGRSLRAWWRRDNLAWATRLTNLGLGVLGFLGTILFLFLFLWGYNYSRVPLESQLALELTPLAQAEVQQELYKETEIIKALRQQIPEADTDPLDSSHFPPKLEAALRAGLEQWLSEHGYPTYGRVRARNLYPKGIFLRFSSAGLYFPFTGEGHADAGLHPLQKVSVMAHEMGHGYGFGDEGTCNFLAYVATENAEDPAIAYAGHLDHWRTLAVEYRRYEPEAYRQFRESLPLGIQADLDAINEVLRRYPDIMPQLRYRAYDAYLRAQGIQEGMKNYNRVTMMVRAWRLRRQI